MDTLGNRGRVMHRVAGCLFKVLKTSGSSELEGFIDDLLASPSRGAISEADCDIVTNLSTSGPG